MDHGHLEGDGLQGGGRVTDVFVPFIKGQLGKGHFCSGAMAKGCFALGKFTHEKFATVQSVK